MAGMYEKLGDLLNETLEAGHVKFVHIEREDVSDEPDGNAAPDDEAGQDSAGAGGQTAGSQSAEGQPGERKDDADFARSFYQAETEAERRYFRTSRGDADSGSGYRRVIYRYVSPELEKAFAMLGLDSTADKDAVKKAYKEKLLYYHPDRYAGKDVMEKVANDKTRELVAAYKRIIEFLA